MYIIHVHLKGVALVPNGLLQILCCIKSTRIISVPWFLVCRLGKSMFFEHRGAVWKFSWSIKMPYVCRNLGNMISSHICHILRKTMLQPVILLSNVCSMSECLFLFWSMWFLPLSVYPIVFRHPGLPGGGKHNILQASMKWVRDLRFYPN